MVKSPHYGPMTAVKSPTYARPPPQRLNIDRCIKEKVKLTKTWIVENLMEPNTKQSPTNLGLSFGVGQLSGSVPNPF